METKNSAIGSTLHEGRTGLDFLAGLQSGGVAALRVAKHAGPPNKPEIEKES